MSDSVCHVQLFATPLTVACQAPLSMGFSRQGYWSGLPVLSPGDLPNPGIKPRCPELQADSLPSESPGKPQEYCSGLTLPSPGDLHDPGKGVRIHVCICLYSLKETLEGHTRD